LVQRPHNKVILDSLPPSYYGQYDFTICGGYSWYPCYVPPDEFDQWFWVTAIYDGIWVNSYSQPFCHTYATLPLVSNVDAPCYWAITSAGWGYPTNYVLARDVFSSTVGIGSLSNTWYYWYWVNIYVNGWWLEGCKECLP
jgi:hypothetical protein